LLFIILIIINIYNRISILNFAFTMLVILRTHVYIYYVGCIIVILQDAF